MFSADQVFIDLGDTVNATLTPTFVEGSSLRARRIRFCVPLCHGIFFRLVVGMKRDHPILANDTLEEQKIPLHFVTVVHLA